MNTINYPLAFRSASPADSEIITLVENQARAGFVGAPIPEVVVWPDLKERIRQRLEEPTTWSRIAFDGIRSVAFIFGYPIDGKRKTHYLDMLMIHPNYWGQGIATELVNWAVQTVRSDGADSLSLWTAADNVRARQLYERLGFTATEQLDFNSCDQSLPIEFVLKVQNTVSCS